MYFEYDFVEMKWKWGDQNGVTKCLKHKGPSHTKVRSVKAHLAVYLLPFFTQLEVKLRFMALLPKGPYR